MNTEYTTCSRGKERGVAGGWSPPPPPEGLPRPSQSLRKANYFSYERAWFSKLEDSSTIFENRSLPA